MKIFIREVIPWIISVLLVALVMLSIGWLLDAKHLPAPIPCESPTPPDIQDNPIPQAKSEIAIAHTLLVSRLIVFQTTTPALAQAFDEFGDLANYSNRPHEYWLTVDAYYDFEEVIRYIENYQPEE